MELRCDFAGIAASDIERFGMWRTGQISSSLLDSYMCNIPCGPMAALAGGRNVGGQLKYHMFRNFVTHSKELRRKIFPFINKYLEAPMNINIEELIEHDDKYSNNTKQMAYLATTVFDHLHRYNPGL